MLSVTVFDLCSITKRLPHLVIFNPYAAREGVDLSSPNFYRFIILCFLTKYECAGYKNLKLKF
jgi:hypothetical protein